MQAALGKAKHLLTSITSRFGYVKPTIASAALLYFIYRLAQQHGWLPKKSLSGEVVFITGGARGLGRQLAFRMARMGAKIVVSDVNEEEGAKVAANITAERKLAIFVQCDVTSPESVAAAAVAARAKFGPPTILINNAGIVSGKKLLEVSAADMELTMKVNVISHMHTVREFLPAMMESNHGHIVTIASMAGMSGHAGLVDYCASKFGAVGFDEALRRELKVKRSSKT
jgi:all-trans-retinol dehydrogenase (NAD+)